MIRKVKLILSSRIEKIGIERKKGVSIIRLKNGLLRHPLIALFGLTFLVNWSLGFTYLALFLRGEFLWMPLVAVAPCALGLVAVLISSISNTEEKQGSKMLIRVIYQ